MEDSISFLIPITKTDDDLKVVWGWASMVEKNGEPVIDRQGDVIRESVLQKAAHNFMVDERTGKVMHQGKRVADVVESIVLTKAIQKTLGVDLGQSGWFIGMKIRDNDLWQKVKSGEFTAFSVGGQGQRIPINFEVTNA